MGVARGELSTPIQFSADAAVTVVLAAPNYPGTPTTGGLIRGLGENGQLVDPIEGVTIFHAGTKRPDPHGSFVVSGGRVLNVTARAATIEAARKKAYSAAARIEFEGMQRREDIASIDVQEEG